MAELIADEASPVAGRRAENLDVLRAAAALSVVAGHSYLLGGRELPFLPESVSDLLLRQTATGVWLFFVLSGYLITKPFVTSLIEGRDLPPLVPYGIRRAFRLFPAYWIALTAVVLIGGVKGARLWHIAVHYALLHNLIPGRERALYSVAWTLTVELLFYITVPLAALAIRRTVGRRPISPGRLATAVAVTWGLSAAWRIAAGSLDGMVGQWLRVVFPASWSYFCPGILLAIGTRTERGSQWYRSLVLLPSSRAAVVGSGVLVASATALTWVARPPMRVTVIGMTWGAAQQIFAVAYGLLVGYALTARPWHERLGRWASELGLISYGIYLFHAVILAALLEPWGRRLIPLRHTGAVAFVVHVVFLAGLTVPVAWLSWRCFERPLNDLARRIGTSAATRSLGRTIGTGARR